MATLTTDKNRNLLLPKSDFLSDYWDCKFYSLPWATTESPQLLFDNFTTPLALETSQAFQIWNSEDLFKWGWLLATVQRLKLTNRALARSYSLWRRANALNVSFKTLYGFQSTLLTQLLKLNYPVILSHPRSTKISLETSPSNKRKLGFFSIKHLMHKPFDLFGKYPQGNK